MRPMVLIEDGRLRVVREGAFCLPPLLPAGQAPSVLDILQPYQADAEAMQALRGLLRWLRGALPVQLWGDHQVLELVARAVESQEALLRVVRIPRMTGGLVEASRAEPSLPPEGPRRPQTRTWIEFQVVDDASSRPLGGVRLTVRTGDEVEACHTTAAVGKVRLESIGPGACDVWCDRKNLKLAEALAFVKLGGSAGQAEAPAGEAEAPPGEAEAPPGQAAGPAGLKRIVQLDAHKVKKGQSLASLAQSAGMTWQELARFNWDTDVPKEINRRLYDEVGCTKKTADGKNYVFDDSDCPGIVLIPRAWRADGLATGQTHVIRVSPIKPPFVVLLESEQDLRIPEADWELEFADGSQRKGQLGLNGMSAILDYPDGPILVSFPDADDILAKSLAAGLRKGFDDHEVSEVFRLLQHPPQTIQQAIKAYEKYFNDYTGKGLIEDIYQEVSDAEVLEGVEALMAYNGLPTRSGVQARAQEDDDEDAEPPRSD